MLRMFIYLMCLSDAYGHIYLCQYWLSFVWRHQSITWTNIDLSAVRFWGIHLRAISHEMLEIYILYFDMSVKITNFILQLRLLGNYVSMEIWRKLHADVWVNKEKAVNRQYILWLGINNRRSNYWRSFAGYLLGVGLCRHRIANSNPLRTV